MTGGDPESHLNRIQLGARLREARAFRGMTQEDTAKAARLALTYLSQIEHGKQNITIEKIVRIANALDHDVTIILTPRETRSRPEKT